MQKIKQKDARKTKTESTTTAKTKKQEKKPVKNLKTKLTLVIIKKSK